MMNKRSIGLALSGGGVKGLAHIGLLKALDQLDIEISLISGTSMGAIIGALYASGISGQDIEDRVREHIITKGSKPKHIIKNRKNLFKWSKVFSFEKQAGGFFAADGLFEHLFSELIDLEFTDLPIPFHAVSTDFHTGSEFVLSEGPLLPAIKASMAVPGVFAPVQINGRTLIDGGLVNNLPVNHISTCDFRIASDVIALPTQSSPKVKDLLAGSLSIMIHHASEQQIRKHPCDFVHEVDTNEINTFDFLKIEQSLLAGDSAALVTTDKLKTLLGADQKY